MVTTTVVAGGLRRGEVMLLTAYGAERMSADRLAQQLAPAPNTGAGSDPCVKF